MPHRQKYPDIREVFPLQHTAMEQQKAVADSLAVARESRQEKCHRLDDA
ncbi:hypothetical protein O5625_25780, partial [Escherichia coli]|nr:hypothetical protein [Escherichia coli]